MNVCLIHSPSLYYYYTAIPILQSTSITTMTKKKTSLYIYILYYFFAGTNTYYHLFTSDYSLLTFPCLTSPPLLALPRIFLCSSTKRRKKTGKANFKMMLKLIPNHCDSINFVMIINQGCYTLIIVITTTTTERRTTILQPPLHEHVQERNLCTFFCENN